MIGIYKISSPTGRVYIGQSYYIEKRIRSHFSHSNSSARKRLFHYPIYNSINKYGLEAHTVSIIHELPSDVQQSVMDNYEQLYIMLYKEAGVCLLNLTEGGNSGKRCQETKDRMSKSAKGKIISVETRVKISQRLKGTTQPRYLAEKRGDILRNLNRKVTPEHKAILTKSLQGNERNNCPVTLTDINTNKQLHFTTVKKAAIFLKSSQVTVHRYLYGVRIGNTVEPHNSKYSSNIFKGYKISQSIQ